MRASNDVIKLDFQELIKRARAVVGSSEVCAASIVIDSPAVVECAAISAKIAPQNFAKILNIVLLCYVFGDKTHPSHSCPDRKKKNGECSCN